MTADTEIQVDASSNESAEPAVAAENTTAAASTAPVAEPTEASTAPVKGALSAAADAVQASIHPEHELDEEIIANSAVSGFLEHLEKEGSFALSAAATLIRTAINDLVTFVKTEV